MASDSESDCDIVLMMSEGSVGDHNYWIEDSGATCHMGPSLEGCTDIVYVREKIIVGNGGKSVCKAHTTFNGVAILKMAKQGKLRLRILRMSWT